MSASLTVDYGGDWQHVDGVETVVFRPTVGEPVLDAKALRSPLSRSETMWLAGTLGLEPEDTAWILWDEKLGGQRPVNGDTIEAPGDDEIWVILSLTRHQSVEQTRAICRKLQ